MTSSDLPQEPQKEDTASRLGLILLLLCASFFALYNSNAAYTSDEVWSVKASSQTYSELMTTLKKDVHPPLYFQVLQLWIRLFGAGERVVRSLSGLFYVLAVLLVYGLARELHESRTALVCAALYASSPLAILSAQFSRMYALLSMLSVLSTWLYLQFLLRKRLTLRRLALYAVVNMLGTFTHIAFFFVLFGQIVLYLLINWRVQTKRFVIAIALSVTPYFIFWGPILWQQIGNSGEGLAWVKKPGLSMMGDLIFLYGGVFWLVLPVLLILFWRRRFKFWTELRRSSVPLALCALTLTIPLLISVVKPVFNPRLAIIGLHLFALTVVTFLGRFANFALSSALIVITACFMILVRPASQACDNRGLANYLATTASNNDVAIFTSLTRLPVDYYLQQSSTAKNLFETSFPADIDSHPGYEGRITDPSRRATLELEAQKLVEQIGLMQSTNRDLRVFFFHGLHPEIDSLLEKRLLEWFEPLSDQQIQCTEGSPYLKTISVYRRRTN